MEIKKDIPLAPFTTFGIGGNAKFFAAVKSIEEALEAIVYGHANNLKMVVLGGGSNMLVSDLGFDGLVIKNEIKGIGVEDRYLKVGGGENWDDVVQKAIQSKLQGIECLSAIPGTFGGAIVQNIGAYGQTLSDIVDAVEVIDIVQSKIAIMRKDECEFEYRNSVFKKNPGRYIVVAASLKLVDINRGNISYPSVHKLFEGKTPDLLEVRNAIIKLRAEKGMVIMKDHESYKSAGSYFKNPVISPAHFDKIQPKIKCSDPWYWQSTDDVKVSAACLISEAGFKKGQIIDAAQISPKQPLAIINPGFAKASDIRAAAEKIQQKVKEQFDIILEEEVVYVGNFDNPLKPGLNQKFISN